MKVSTLLSYLTSSGLALAATVKRPSACVDADTNQLLITGQYCGAGETATFAGSATALSNQQCFTQSGNPVQGVPKKKSGMVDIDATISPTDTGCVPICILSDAVSATLQCTGNQEARIVGPVSFVDVSITGSNLPKPITFKSVTKICTSSDLACTTTT
ncbi:hypothetical protein N7532_002204 [Penicillium argentinense]|uniref:Uncharacterized protein n=1 Tax=Penicillium argentinense TaxID=1131581 RepID=A0A9W9KK26_9EURO|nr:uncharacterized protein N7532_002204 [Penicillium argentinense]KAJ5109559.1 hypothetical protein N7532_002204 [Penicillium argentinense]